MRAGSEMRLANFANLSGVNYLGRSCCLRVRCYRTKVSFGFLPFSVTMIDGCGHVGEGAGGGQRVSVVHGPGRCAIGASPICPQPARRTSVGPPSHLSCAGCCRPPQVPENQILRSFGSPVLDAPLQRP